MAIKTKKMKGKLQQFDKWLKSERGIRFNKNASIFFLLLSIAFFLLFLNDITIIRICFL